MVNAKLEKRLEQVREWEIPYVIIRGNKLPDFFTHNQIVDDLDGLIEVVDDSGVDLLYERVDHVNGNDAQTKWAQKVAKVLAGVYGVEDEKLFLFFTGTRGDSIGTHADYALTNIENHYIYDPSLDLTHMFMLPKRDLKEDKK